LATLAVTEALFAVDPGVKMLNLALLQTESSMGEGLLCVGLTTLDVSARPIAALPPAETTALVDQITLAPAGTAAGAALVAARLGVKTALAGAVGEDPAGTLVRSVLGDHGVDLTCLARLQGVPTSTTILLIDADGQRPNIHAVGASFRAEVTPAWTEAATKAKFVHYAGIGGPKLDGGPGAALAAAAKAAGAVVTCDLISPGRRAMEELARMLPHVDFFMPNGREALALTGRSSLAEAAAALLDLGARCCIFKNGAEGSVIIDKDGETRLPAHEITVVDTTSCGDSYCAGFITALDRGRDVVEAARFASATAALVAQGLGTLGVLQDFEATDRYMREAPVRSLAA
jgi:sugar/nucleoside kinase (ribokinase family)